MRLTDEAALDVAFELFMTLAPDNLSEAEMLLFNKHFNDSGFIELFDFDESTLDSLDLSSDIEANEYNSDEDVKSPIVVDLVEIIVGAKIHNSHEEQLPTIFAKIILSINTDKQFSHIQWMSDLNA